MISPVLRRRDLPPWQLGSVLIAIGLTIGLTLAGVLVLSGAIAVIGSGSSGLLKSPGAILGDTLIQDLALIGGVMLAVKLRSGFARLVDFGVVRVDRLLRAVGLSIAIWLTFLVFAAVWGALIGPHGKQTLIKDLGADRSAALWLGTAVLVTVFAPISEEFAFRGFLFTVFSRNWGFVIGAVVTGLLFGALHVGATPVELAVPLAVLGMLLCLLRVLTGSILPGIAVHTLNNAVAFSVAEAVPLGWSLVLIACGLTITTSIGAVAARRA
jgi:membrane protease YdiL (CAAX protease family)